MQSDEVYVRVLTRLLEDGTVTEAELNEEIGDPAAEEFVPLFFDVYTNEGYIEADAQGKTTQYTLVDRGWANDLLTSLQSVENTAPTDISGTSTLVANVPPQLLTEFDKLCAEHPDVQVHRLRDAFARIIDSTTTIARWAVPYFEYSGIESLEDEFEALAARDVDVRVLTRGVLERKSSGSYVEKLRGLKLLLDKYDAHASTGTIELREFEQRIGAEDTEFHYMGVHQKMLIADDTEAYVGSGEIRRGSLQLNGEAGQITTDPAEVAFWSDYYDLFWDRSETISEEFLLSQL